MTITSEAIEASGKLELMQQAALAAARAAIINRRMPVEETSHSTSYPPPADGYFVNIKPDDSKVTSADLLAQHTIETALNSHLPNPASTAPFLGEENAYHDYNARQGWQWVVDPIDGTSNFVAGHDSPRALEEGRQWAVSIALCHNGVTQAAAVYVAKGNDGWDGTLYSAVRGMGSFQENVQNMHPVADSKQRITHREPAEGASPAPVNLGFFAEDCTDGKYQGKREEGAVYKAVSNAATRESNPIVPTRCACADALGVLDGTFSAYAHGIHFPWDQAAMSLIFSEAGYPLREYESKTDAG